MMHRWLLIATLVGAAQATRAAKPNVLWILTDDHRYDSIRAFNRMLHGREMSALGYVESPQTDRLAAMGTTFINTYCQAMGCAPSRASMHYGRYPFRSGIYEFEYHNNTLEHCRPTLPERMVGLGYQTLHIGKLGVRVKGLTEEGKTKPHAIYQTSIGFRDLGSQNMCGWGRKWLSELNGVKLPKGGNYTFMVDANGTRLWYDPLLEAVPGLGLKGQCERLDRKYEMLHHYNSKKPKKPGSGMIIAGVSSREAGKTRDGYYSSVFADYLKTQGRDFKVGALTFEGLDTAKPLFCHIGYDFPHTPVLPPADYRARFQKHTYKVPAFDEKELETMPKQLRQQVRMGYSDHFTAAEKQAMIQDYYAFCAYGDALIGQAADAFVEYSEKQKQPWMIVYVCGDHGWKLNDHGSVSKFTPWKVDSHDPIIVVSSDKKAFPAGKVVTDFTEFVDIAPTILAAGGAKLDDGTYEYLDGRDMAKTASGELPPRDYVIGESHAVTGPRAYIRTKEFVFSMQTRPDKKRGQNLDWIYNTSWEELDPALYHMPSDPHEVKNLAFSKEYGKVAQAMRKKLTDIVMGGRVEVNWEKWGSGTETFRSNIAPGAHDGKLNLAGVK